MNMRMPNLDQLGACFFHTKDKFCITGWINYQYLGIHPHRKFKERCTEFYLEHQDLIHMFDRLILRGEKQKALALIAETMVSLGHTPIYDPNCTEPYWKVPEEKSEGKEERGEVNLTNKPERSISHGLLYPMCK